MGNKRWDEREGKWRGKDEREEREVKRHEKKEFKMKIRIKFHHTTKMTQGMIVIVGNRRK